ncbi:gfo/Idh/MocA family oxidoreductase [Candidatus Bathyarchaeota archaeon]|nr:MAG: gfo/Idh/MocA family oxidoreductase [Candidatus Bathyarchaeota archaeon]
MPAVADAVRVGFVGCGGMGIAHMKSLVENPKAVLVAFCDINLKKAEDAARSYGSEDAQAFDSAEKMFKSIKLDAVYFCLPPFAHGAEMEAIKRGVPFFVEKPINLYLDQARKISKAVERKKLMTSVGYMNRYRRGVQMVREILKEDPPILVLGGWIIESPSPTPSMPIVFWWVRKEKSGGQFHEQVTHTVDLARFLCGEIVEVHAFSAKGFNREVTPGYNIEDAAVVNLKFAGGAVGNLWASCSSNGGGGGVSLSVYCLKTTALFNGWRHDLRLLRKGEEAVEVPGEENIFAIEDKAFIEAVLNDDPSKILCPYSDGLRTLEVTLAANKSMETGRPVKIRRRENRSKL